MSMLARYKKKGGFEQLLNLMETSGTKKQEQLLKLVAQEDAAYAVLLKSKILTFERMTKWDQTILAEIVADVPARFLALALKPYPEDMFKKFTATLPHAKHRELRDAQAASVNPAEVEISQMKIVTKARELDKLGKIHLSKIDPTLEIKEAA